MKKKTLEQLPLPPYPQEFPPAQALHDRQQVVVAQTVEADGQELLEITGFQMGSDTPSWRTFMDVAGEKYISQHLLPDIRWSRQVMGTLLYGPGPYSRYGIDRYDYLIRDHDRKVILNALGYNENHWNTGNPLDLVANFQRSIGAEKRERQKDRVREVFDYVESILPALPPDLDRFIQDTCLPGSRYLFFSRKDREGIRAGWCTSCMTEVVFLDFDVKHKAVDTCPNCCEIVQYRAEGLSRTKLIDRAAFSITQPGPEPHELIIRYFEVERDYNGDPRQARNHLMETARYYLNLQTQNAYQWRQSWKYWWFDWRDRDDELHPSGFTHRRGWDPPGFQHCGPTVHHYPLKAIKRTAFSHCGYDLYTGQLRKEGRLYRAVDPATFLCCYTKCPCLEYLLKLGFFRLTQELLCGEKKLLNPSGKTPEEIFGMPMQDIRLLRRCDPDADTLRLYRLLRSQGKQIARPDLEYLAGHRIRMEQMEYLLKHLSPARIAGYIRKQVDTTADGPRKRTPDSICRDWVDYLKDLTERLRQPLTSENLRPAHLYEAHTRILAQIEDRDNPQLNKDIRKLAKQYNRKYAFSHAGLSIRAAWSCGELIAEGKRLSHCVGRYGSKVAEKQCAILLIRREEAPDAPFFTLEIQWRDKKQKEPKVVQCRGHRNSEATGEVRAFLKAWEEEKLLPKEKREADNRIPVAIAG